MLASSTIPQAFIDKNHAEILKLLTDFMGFNYSIMDTEGNFIFRNETFMASFPGLDIENGKELWADCVAAMKSGERVAREEACDGKYYFSVKQPLIQDSKCVGIMVFSFDITEKKQAEAAKKQFIKSINHDIRTPLMGAIGLTDSLARNEVDVEKQEKMSMVSNCLSQLMEHLEKSLSVAANGNVIHKKEEFLLQEIVEEVICSLLPSIKNKGLRISEVCTFSKIYGYKSRIKDAILNVISNSVKYSTQGKITVSAVVAEDEGKYSLIITVKDKGIGIAPEHHEKIFDNFYRVIPSELEPRFNGYGMGLYLVKQTVIDLGGEIELISALGAGSTFIITLPVEVIK